MENSTDYPARLEIDYPEKLDRLTTLLRIVWILPIAFILGLIWESGETLVVTVVLNTAAEVVERTEQTPHRNKTQAWRGTRSLSRPVQRTDVSLSSADGQRPE